MRASPKSAGKAASRIAGTEQNARLNPVIACDTAFRIIARRCLADLTATHAATCRGDAVALHRMRIALTRLRTAISFFSPMVIDAQQIQIRRELKWLSAHLGAVRDLDVLSERLRNRRQAPASKTRLSTLESKARDGHRLLARVLQSARYRRLVENTAVWVENGLWSMAKGKQATQARACQIGAYGARKLARWQRKLLKRSRRLADMGAKKRHRLRLRNKRLTYSVGFFEDFIRGKNSSRQKAALKYLRKAQKSLGQLNDDARARSLAAAAGSEVSLQLLRGKRKKRLLETAAAAYRKLAALKPAFARGVE